MHRARVKLHRERIVESLEARLLLTTYYVSPTGSDAAAGSLSTPFSTLQHGVSVLVPGDTLNAEPGSYSAGFIIGWNPPNSGPYSQITGTSTAPITIQVDPAAAPGSVVITGRNNKTADAIDFEGGDDWISIRGFTINNTSGTITRDGIRVSGSNNVSVLNNLCEGMNTFGIFSSFTTNFLVQNNTCTNVQGSASTTGHGIYVSNSPVSPVIRGNLVYGNTGEGIHINGDGSQGGNGLATGAVIEGNIIHDNALGNGINCDGIQTSRIQNNLIYNQSGFGVALYQIDASGPSKNNVIVNNTIVCPSGAAALRIKDAATGNDVYNNVLIGGSNGALRISADSLSGLFSDYNTVVNVITSEDSGATESFSEWKQQTGQDPHSLLAPASLASLFVNPSTNPPDYHLIPGSAAVDAGGSIASPNQPPLYDLDFAPRPGGSAWDIGAYEYQAPLTLPGAPSNLSATPADPLSINLSWTDNSTNESSFQVERATDAVHFAQIASLGLDVTAYADAGVTPGVTYSYRVRAANAAGISAYSNIASAVGPPVPATPAAPSGLVAAEVAGYTHIALNWADNSDNETAFLIERSADDITFSQIANVGANITTYTDSGLAPNTKYWYRVRATNSGSNSAYSNTASATAAVGTGPYSLWDNSATPLSPNDPDTSATEVGLKFYSDITGTVSAIRFYKGSQNTGTHTAHLWTGTGRLLATATFTGETASGWQTATLSQPVLLQANVVYIASYYAPNGHYADDSGAFSTAGIDNAPLHAPADGVDGPNGVYIYGPNGTFPTNPYQADNYWVDVVFKPQHPALDVINLSNGSGVTLTQDPDHQHVDWVTGTTAAWLAIDDPNGLVINGSGGNDLITLNYANGNPLPSVIAVNGTFTLQNLSGASPFAGTTLDVGRSTVYVSYGNSALDPIGAIRDCLSNGYADGTWRGSPNSTGAILSSAAASGPPNVFGIGYADSADGVVSGQPANTVEIRYTVMGDANLDRTVNMGDATLLQANWAAVGSPAWDRGNFDYNAAVEVNDALIMERNWTVTASGSVVVATSTSATIQQAVTTRPNASHSNQRPIGPAKPKGQLHRRGRRWVAGRPV